MVTYQELTNIIGRDIIKHRHALQSARTKLLKEGCVFGIITRVGIKRLSDSEAIMITSTDTVQRIRRTAKRGVRVLAYGIQNFATLSNEDKILHNATASMLGAIAFVSTTKNVERLASKSENGQLPIASTLEFFKD